MKGITIVTPTFNRGNYLFQIYKSLVLQTNYSFQWLIVDDGSTDQTEKIVQDILKQHSDLFLVDYVRKDNGGKQSSLNYSHPYIKGKYVMVLDSDDFLPQNSIKIILEKIKKLSHSHKIGWLAFLKGNEDGTTSDSLYKEDGEIMDYPSYMNEGRKGECCDIYLKEVFIAYPYPQYPNEKFISESFLNIQAAVYGNYKMITFNVVVQIVEYLEEGLTLQGRGLQIKNPRGHAELWRHVSGGRFNLKQNFKGAWLYIAYSFFAEAPLKVIVQKSLNKPFTILNIPIGYAIYLVWNHQYL